MADGRGLSMKLGSAWGATQSGVQSLRVGLKLTSGSDIEAGLEIGQRATLRGETQHAVQLRGSMRW